MTFDTPCNRLSYCTFAHSIDSICVQGCDCDQDECYLFHSHRQNFIGYVMARKNEIGILDWHVEEYHCYLLKQEEIQKKIKQFLETIEEDEKENKEEKEEDEKEEKELKIKKVEDNIFYIHVTVKMMNNVNVKIYLKMVQSLLHHYHR